MNTQPAPFAGICVSQEHLDVGVGADGPGWLASHDLSAIRLTADRMAEIRPALVLIESTDAAAWTLISDLFAFGIPAVLLDPGGVRELAQSLRIPVNHGETEGHFLARLAEAGKLPPMTLPPATIQRLSAYVWRRRQLEDELAIEAHNRLNAPFTRRAAIEERITHLQQELDRLSALLRHDFQAGAASMLASAKATHVRQAVRPLANWMRTITGESIRPTPRTRAAMFAVLAIGALGLAGLYIRQTFWPLQPASTTPRVVDIRGSMNGFDRSELHVKLGLPVTIRLTSVDNPLHTDGGGRHQWAVDELRVNLIAPPAGSNTVTFTPEKAGKYVFYCDICCGGRANPSMSGTLIVDG